MRFWDRVTLKERAKIVLKNTYWMTFLALLIISFMGASSNGSSQGIGATVSSAIGGVVTLIVSLITSTSGYYNGWGNLPGFALAGSVIFLIYTVIFLFAAAFVIFLGNVMHVGKCRYLTMCRYGEVDLGQLFFPFKAGQYGNTVKVMFFKDLQIFLWSLLFVIPGIIKSFEYWMVPYILAENPFISKERAFEISSNATRGEKWDIFVLQLSFIGWFFLGVVAGCGIGSLFVSPYYEATQAELYGALRYKAVMTGLCTKEEIGRELFVPN